MGRQEHPAAEGRQAAKAHGRRRGFFACALFALCAMLVAALAVYAAEGAVAAGMQDFSLEQMPLATLLLAALRQLYALIRPFAVPLLLAVLLCALLAAAKAVYTEERRFGRLSAGGCLAVSLDAFRRFLLALLRWVPEILVILLLAAGLNSLLLGIGRFRKVADDMRRIRELGVMVRNLSRADDVAQITLLSQRGGAGGDVEKTYRIEILSEQGKPLSEQTVTLRGNRIAIDSITVNFDYSQIETGQQNIAYPYRVYSELMKPEDAVPLTCMFNDEQLPVIYCLEESSIYGMEADSFFRRLKELFAILGDERQCRELGIRSVNGTVSHFVVSRGEVWRVSVLATGGLAVRKKLSLADDARW